MNYLLPLLIYPLLTYLAKINLVWDGDYGEPSCVKYFLLFTASLTGLHFTVGNRQHSGSD